MKDENTMKSVVGIKLNFPVTVTDYFGNVKVVTCGLKCKHCKNEFFVYRYGYYYREVCFCPYCGAPKKEKE